MRISASPLGLAAPKEVRELVSHPVRGDRDGRAPSRVRQADVARAGRVTQATVSMVLNGSAGISEVTRKRIVAVARDLGYSVNPVARSLAGGRNRLLGVYTFEAVFPTVSRDFYQPFLSGVEREAERVGYDLLLFTSASLPGNRRSIYAGGVNRLAVADGSILLGRQDDKAEIARLVKENFPFVYIGRREVEGSEISYVTADYADATGHVVQHLFDLGHRSLVYLGVRSPKEPDRDREAGWTEAVSRLRLSADQAVLVRLTSYRSLPTLITELRRKYGVTACVVEDPESAQQVFDAVERLGLRVPDDISLAVLGDDPSVTASEENWSGFRISREAMGRQAVRLLLEALEESGSAARQVTVPCPLVVGKTVGPPAAPGPASRTRKA